MKKIMMKLCAIGLLALAGASSGCMYAGVASSPDGTVYVARNDLFLFGLLRKVYACKPTGNGLACVETQAP
jgi:hypothetical protein